MEDTVTTVRHAVDRTITVYRENHYCGMIFCPPMTAGGTYLASPWTNEVPRMDCLTEQSAIDYLVREA